MRKKAINNAGAFLVTALGVILRLYYIITTKVCNLGQYDLGGAIPDKGILNGHIGYIYYLFINKAIPDFDPLSVYEFYQPPTHYILSAFWLSLVSRFTDSIALQTELIQAVPFVESVLGLLVVYFITKELSLSKRGTFIVMCTVSLNPASIFMAGSINNDVFSYLFHYIVILCAIRWYKKKDLKNIIILALVMGIAVLSKLSTGLVAVPLAFMFLYVFVSEWKNNGKFPVKRFLHYLLFGVISIPIGLAWVVRCNIKFGVPLNYVGTLSDDTWGYVGDYSFVSRFLPPNPVTLLKNMRAGGIGYSQNIWVQMFRTSACTEADMAGFPVWAKLLIVLMMGICFITALVSIIGFIKNFTVARKKYYLTSDACFNLFWVIAYAAMAFSYFSFAYNYPQQCSMNFRYMVPILMYPAVGLALSSTEDEGRAHKIIINTVFTLYALVSTILVLTWWTYTQTF